MNADNVSTLSDVELVARLAALDLLSHPGWRRCPRRRSSSRSRSAPGAAKGSQVNGYIPNEDRRKAVARDGYRCSFVSDDGRRCEETGFLELDHVVPVAMGGQASDGVRVLCRAHNQFEAERVLGRDVVEAGKAAKAMDDDLIAGMRRMGVTASDARQAVTVTRGPGTVEDRLRAALAALRSIYDRRKHPTRCEEPQRGYACRTFAGGRRDQWPSFGLGTQADG